MTVIAVRASSIRDACAFARRQLGLHLKDSRETLRSGGEDGLYRVHLSEGTIVEVTTAHHSKAELLAVDS